MITIILANENEMIMTYPKIILKVKNIPMIVRTINNAILLNSEKIFIVLNKSIKDQVINNIKKYVQNTNIFYVIQSEQTSEINQIRSCVTLLKDVDPFDKIMVMPIDIPLLSPYTLLPFKRWKNNNDSRILACKLRNPDGYNRVIRDKRLNFVEIKSDKECNNDEKKIPYISTDILMFRYYQLIENNTRCSNIIEFINILKPSIYMLEDKFQKELIKIKDIKTLRNINRQFGL